MFKRLLFASALTLALAPSSFAQDKAAATPPSGSARGPRDVEAFVSRLEKELSLTPEQSAQVRKVLRRDSLVPPPESLREPRPGMRGEEFPMSGEFLAQLRADKVDTAALNRRFEERANALRAQHARRLDTFVKLHAILTPAQRVKFAENLEKRRARMDKDFDRKAGKEPRGKRGEDRE